MSSTAATPAEQLLPEPIVPDYAGPNVRGIIPGMLGPQPWSALPAWFPSPLREARQAVLLVLDGLGWEQLEAHRDLMPNLGELVGGPITTVAPTTTATALTSIATGLTPGEHGVVGYRMVVRGEVLNILRWSVAGSDRRRSIVPEDTQPFTPFLGQRVPVISQAELEPSAFSAAHLRGCRPVGYRAPSSIAVEVRHQFDAGERFVYAYYGGIDKIAHERGFGPYYDAELRAADRLVGDIAAVLPDGATLCVTADHGQVDVGDNIVVPDADLLQAVTLQSGEGRFRWWHTAAPVDLAIAAAERYGEIAWVRTREQLLDERWFGPVVPPPIAARLGDVALIPFRPVSFHDPDDTGPFQLVCRHGSLTSAEVLVPFVASVVK